MIPRPITLETPEDIAYENYYRDKEPFYSPFLPLHASGPDGEGVILNSGFIPYLEYKERYDAARKKISKENDHNPYDGISDKTTESNIRIVGKTGFATTFSLQQKK